MNPDADDIGIKLGEDLTQLERSYGTALQGSANNILRFDNTKLGKVEIRLDNDNKVSRIYIRDTKYKSDKNIKVGSSRNQVRTAYGDPIRSNANIDFFSFVPGAIILIVTYHNDVVTILTIASI